MSHWTEAELAQIGRAFIEGDMARAKKLAERGTDKHSHRHGDGRGCGELFTGMYRCLAPPPTEEDKERTEPLTPEEERMILEIWIDNAAAHGETDPFNINLFAHTCGLKSAFDGTVTEIIREGQKHGRYLGFDLTPYRGKAA